MQRSDVGDVEQLPVRSQRVLRKALQEMCSPHHDAVARLLDRGRGSEVAFVFGLRVSVHARDSSGAKPR